MATKVRYSGVYILPVIDQGSLHSKLWHRIILSTSRFSNIFLLATILKSLCHHIFCHTHKKYEIFPRVCHPGCGIKKWWGYGITTLSLPPLSLENRSHGPFFNNAYMYILISYELYNYIILYTVYQCCFLQFRL